MTWEVTYRSDPRARAVADRHYNRQSVGAVNFAPPGRALVLLTPDADALWVTSWPYPEYVLHEWRGAWINSAFRNEAPDRHLSSDLILEAVAVTRARWADVPALGMVTFIDTRKVRRKRDPGRCYRRAGFVPVGHTKSGLLALQLPPDAMPPAHPAPPGLQLALTEEAA